MNTKILFQSFLFFVCILKINAQEILTIENAVKIALENNYEIKISSNNLAIDKANVSTGNAGVLPRVTASFVDNNSIQDLSQTRADGKVNTLDNAKNSNLNYGVGLDWTIFDGFKMFAKLDQLKEFEKLGETQLKLTIITKISNLNAVYFELVNQQQQLAALNTTIEISIQRLALAKNRFSIGKASKLEVLNAQVDLNTDKTEHLRQKELYANTKIILNQLMARDPKKDFKVVDLIKVDNSLLLDELTSMAQKQNPELQTQIINQRISELQLKQIKGERYPTINLTSGYQFSENQSGLGFTTQSSAQGLNYGLRASLNLFDGNAQNRNEKIAKIEIDNTKLAIEQQNQKLSSQLASYYQTYLTNLDLIKIEFENEAIAKQNLEITVDKFKIGTITTLEFRTAQLNYVNAKLNYSKAQFRAKLTEILLKELAGNLSF